MAYHRFDYQSIVKHDSDQRRRPCRSVWAPTGLGAFIRRWAQRGHVAPADRYVSSQVTDADVTLGDTAVPELMQTDAFELMVHDTNFRALAASPGFQALAGQPQVMAALMSNPQAFAALASHPQAFAERRESGANCCDRSASQAHQASAALMGAVAGHPAAMQALGAHPERSQRNR